MTLDFFGTLVEVADGRPTISELLTGIGLTCSPEVEAIWDSPGFDGQQTPAGTEYELWRVNNLRRLVSFVGAAPGQVDELVRLVLKNDREWTVRRKSGALELLDVLEDLGLPYVLCTNWDYDLRPYLTQAGLPVALPHLTSAEVGARKPNAAIFTRCLERLRCEATHGIHVGDSWSADVVGALRVGMRAVHLTDQPATCPDAKERVMSASSLWEIAQIFSELACR